MITPGQKMDVRFRVKVVANGVPKEVEFAELLTRRTIVSVYMKNNTPTCDRQTESLRAHAAEFDRAGFNLIALSRDTCGSHGRYATAKNISFMLASDPEDRFAKAVDAMIPKKMYGRSYVGPARSAFIIDRDGTVLAVLDQVDAGNHAAQLKALIDTLPSRTS